MASHDDEILETCQFSQGTGFFVAELLLRKPAINKVIELNDYIALGASDIIQEGSYM
jgi:alpha-D-ribose 1-methylphosphonate 5-triphosphate diphosphatase PhnM